MRQGNRTARFLVGVVLLLVVTSAHAVITALTPLQDVLQQSTFIAAAQVESVDADKPSMVLVVDEDLKGKSPLRKMTVLLKGDSEAKKKNHVPQILKRVAPKLPLLLFVLQQDKKYTAFAYTNGTWFQMAGVEADGAVRWSFTHGEPYLRKTFKGSTAELRQVIIDGLAGKKEPPKPDTKEKPGFGPEVPAEKKSDSRAPSSGGPLFAVIPTVLVGGPIAILAMLFPAVFGGLILVLRRWMAALTVLSLNSTLYVLQDVCGRWLAGSWWGTPSALWLSMTMVTSLGILWAWRRHVAEIAASGPSLFSLPPHAGSTGIQTELSGLAAPPAARTSASSSSPSRVEAISLGVLSGICLTMTAFVLPRSLGQLTQLDTGSKALLMVSAGLCMATLHTLYRRWMAGRAGGVSPLVSRAHQGADAPRSPAALPGEGVLLGTMLLVGVAFSASLLNETSGAGVTEEQGVPTADGWRHRVAWRFRPQVRRCWMASSPVVEGDRVYVGVVLPSAFKNSGAVYCVDRKTGKELWMFNDGGNMKDVFSSPCVADGRLYIGEGFHQHADCKLYCLDAATGKKLWHFTTTSHTESTPCVSGGKVFFGAGDDGLYCLDAATGKQKWHFEGLHIDANPLVIDNRLYGGSGVGDLHRDTMLFCLNADSGVVHWRMAVDLPVWGMPAIQGEYLYAGIGNGNFLVSADQSEKPERPAGEVLCLERATGNRVWRYSVRDGVHVRVCVDVDHVWFASRDRHCYCLDRREGELRWKVDLGSPVVASPSLVGHGANQSLYVASSDGLVSRLDPRTGQIDWTFDAAKDAEQPAKLLSSPLIQVREGRKDESRLIWFGYGLGESATRATLYCLEERAVEKSD